MENGENLCTFAVPKCRYSLCHYALHYKRFQNGLLPLSGKPVCYCNNSPKSIKLYGKIIKILIFSQSLIKFLFLHPFHDPLGNHRAVVDYSNQINPDSLIAQ